MAYGVGLNASSLNGQGAAGKETDQDYMRACGKIEVKSNAWGLFCNSQDICAGGRH